MYLDILFIATIGYAFFKGFSQGIINTVFSVLSIIIALMAAFKLSPYMTEMLEKGFNTYNPFMFVVGFLVTFFLVKWGLSFLSEFVTNLLEVAHFNILNQVMGAGILALVFSFFFSVLVWFADSAHAIPTETKATSISYRFLEPLRESGFSIIGQSKPLFQSFLNRTDKMLDGVEQQRGKKTETKTDIYDIPDQNAPSNNSGQPPR